jgi:hypothetical protein
MHESGGTADANGLLVSAQTATEASPGARASFLPAAQRPRFSGRPQAGSAACAPTRESGRSARRAPTRHRLKRLSQVRLCDGRRGLPRAIHLRHDGHRPRRPLAGGPPRTYTTSKDTTKARAGNSATKWRRFTKIDLVTASRVNRIGRPGGGRHPPPQVGPRGGTAARPGGGLEDSGSRAVGAGPRGQGRAVHRARQGRAVAPRADARHVRSSR